MAICMTSFIHPDSSPLWACQISSVSEYTQHWKVIISIVYMRHEKQRNKLASLTPYFVFLISGMTEQGGVGLRPQEVANLQFHMESVWPSSNCGGSAIKNDQNYSVKPQFLQQPRLNQYVIYGHKLILNILKCISDRRPLINIKIKKNNSYYIKYSFILKLRKTCLNWNYT